MGDRGNFLQKVITFFKIFIEAKELPDDKLLFTYNGLLYPRIICSPATFQAMTSFEAREDDLLMVAYPKCGSNWTLQLLGDMVKCVYYKDMPPTIPLIEVGAPDKFEKLKEESSPRILSTHFPYDNIPKTFFEKKVKILVVFRNPKDTAVSLFHFYNNNPVLPKCSSWDKFFQDFMTGKVVGGSYFDHAVEWNKHIDDERIFIVTFEEMKKDLEAAVKKISDFYEFNLTEEQIQQIAEKGTFKSMKEKSKETHGEIGNAIFRKGEVGDWKNHFSEAQSQEVDAKFEECLAGTKLGEKLNYNAYCKM
ncbi:sulfotransferase 6B1-like [Bombina bombina]|uniref:sulfotransferase 6B1-like n=1 Tax=Bombina bombina TaxID=8345 RepID=UPI00235A850E|nr:sulfotransferase 6B1-like [Bombina bombina]